MEGSEECCAPVPVLYGPTAAAIEALGGQLLPGTEGSIGSVSGTLVDIERRETAVNNIEQPTTDPLKDRGVSAEAEWDLGEMTATAIAAYRTFESQPLIDGDYSTLDMFTASNGQDLDETSLEIRLASDGAKTLDWMVGAYYFDQHIDVLNILDWGADTRTYFDAILPRVFGQPVLNLVENNQMLARGTLAGDIRASEDRFDYNAESYALFGNATWHVSDRFDLTVGARYTDESKDADYAINAKDPFSQINLRSIFNGLFIGLRQLQVAPAVVPFSTDFSDDNLSLMASASYEISSNFIVYARYAQGYKSGGFNLTRTGPNTIAGVPDRVSNYDELVMADPSLTPLQSLQNAVQFLPEEAETFELGFKSRLFDNKLKLDVSVFSQELENFQANSFNGTVFTIRNAGTVEGQGIELDYTWRLSDSLTYTGSASFQDIEYGEFVAAAPTNSQIAAGQATQDLSGETPNFVSDVNLTGNVTFELPISESFDLFARGGYRHRSEYFTAQDLDDVSLQPAFWMFDASLALVPEESFWAVELWVKNLGDETVQNIAFDTSLQAGSYSA